MYSTVLLLTGRHGVRPIRVTPPLQTYDRARRRRGARGGGSTSASLAPCHRPVSAAERRRLSSDPHPRTRRPARPLARIERHLAVNHATRSTGSVGMAPKRDERIVLSIATPHRMLDPSQSSQRMRRELIASRVHPLEGRFRTAGPEFVHLSGWSSLATRWHRTLSFAQYRPRSNQGLYRYATLQRVSMMASTSLPKSSVIEVSGGIRPRDSGCALRRGRRSRRSPRCTGWYART
jgi:hypothetical protein